LRKDLDGLIQESNKQKGKFNSLDPDDYPNILDENIKNYIQNKY